jgi:UDP-2,3-diacylglucosamine hydrolase
MSRTKFYFLSDAHLGSRFKGEDVREKKLAAFCDSLSDQADTLFLLGDIFDFWFEYRTVIPFEHFAALSAFQRLRSRGVRIVYIGGNHDFWTGDFLTRTLGIEMHFAPLTLRLSGRDVCLTHGDGLTREERIYPLFKKVVRNRVNRALYRLIHPDLGVPLAKFISSLSRRHVEKTLDIGKVALRYRDAARALLSSSPIDAVVAGHTHKADLLEWQGKTYVNTGNWIRDFDYAVLENGKFTLHSFR